MVLDDYGDYTTIRALIDGSTNSVDICDVQWGGGYCTEDSECHGKGLCIENQCVCYSNWLCPYCEMGLNEDILIGATCGDYVHGGGRFRFRVCLRRRLRGGLCAAAQQRKHQHRGQHDRKLFHNSSF